MPQIPEEEITGLFERRVYIPSGETRDSLFTRLSAFLRRVFGSRNERVIRSLLPLVDEVNQRDREYCRLPDAGLKEKAMDLRRRMMQDGEPVDDCLPEAFGLVKNACRRLVGQRWSRAGEAITWEIVPFDVQVLGGIVLHQGTIAEMTTGEGKTLVAVFPVVLNALSGANVHIVTVNDFLARRDRDWMGPIYEMLGLSVGSIQSDMEPDDRQRQYACDVTYGTNSEFGFDYLRDNMKSDPAQQVQRGHDYAIVDEVDSILIDEARTPLIISGPTEETAEKYQTADQVARHLKIGEDFEVHEKEHSVILTEEGIEKAQRLVGVDSFYVGKNMDWPHFIDQALRSHYLYRRDKDYVVVQGKVIIVDEFTGRLMAGRRWSDGLHQAVEAKERVPIEEETQTYATITIQNYFRMYKKLAGMTGTAITEAAEFDKIYKLDVLSVPTNRPLRRTSFQDVIYRTFREKLDSIEEEILMMHRTGRPIMCGTISIEKSEVLSERLQRRGIPHEVLNAKHHAREAAIIALAGQIGRVTIATNMAGRGTDIMLGTFTLEELLEHWRRWGLAPKDAAPALLPEALEDRLLDHWMRCFLPKEAASVPKGERRARLEAFWAEIGHPNLRLVSSIAELGGLHIVGTERHEARRIDNQLRGRSGRQGDPGSARFYLSLEDDFLRIFASEKVSNILQRIGMTEGQPIESPMVTRQIERAQRRIEERNFDIRKNLLEYDEVMNEQRKIIYGKRQLLLDHGRVRHLDAPYLAERLKTLVGRKPKEGTLGPAFREEIERTWTRAKIEGRLLPPPPSPSPGAPPDPLEAKALEDARAIGAESAAAAAKAASLGVPPAHLAAIAEAARNLPDAEASAAIAALEPADLRGIVWTWIEELLDDAIRDAFRTKGEDPDPAGLGKWLAQKFGTGGAESVIDPRDPAVTRTRIVEGLTRAYDDRERAIGREMMRRIERFLVLNAIDTRWKDHLLNMDHLKSGIGLRGYGQKDPKVEYKKEGFELFQAMIASIKEEVTDMILRVRLDGEEKIGVFREDAFSYDQPTAQAAAAADANALAAEGGGEKVKPIRAEKRIGRNDPCPCGSGKKYKKCCGPRTAAEEWKREKEESERARKESEAKAAPPAGKAPAGAPGAVMVAEDGGGNGRDGGPEEGEGDGEDDFAEEPSPEDFEDEDDDDEESERASAPRDPAGGRAANVRRARPNDPCPCGSGKKFKKCHGARR